jgi:uncharacterized membrane protein YedE/YeeE
MFLATRRSLGVACAFIPAAVAPAASPAPALVIGFAFGSGLRRRAIGLPRLIRRSALVALHALLARLGVLRVQTRLAFSAILPGRPLGTRVAPRAALVATGALVLAAFARAESIPSTPVAGLGPIHAHFAARREAGRGLSAHRNRCIALEPAKDPVDDPRPGRGRPFGRASGFRPRGLR